MKSDDWVLICERGGGQPPFTLPTEKYLQNNEAFKREILHIHQVHPQVDPNNPEQYKHETSNSGFERRFPVFINIITDANRIHNTSLKRTEWANTFVNYFNHPQNLAKYTYPVSAQFAGDLTPHATSNTSASFLSDFLTINDTMLVMREALMQQDMTDLVPIGDILEQEDALHDYYSPTALEKAHQKFQRFRNHIPGGSSNNDHEQDSEEFKDFQGFTF